MNNKKLIGQTVGVAIGGVAITESNKLGSGMGSVVGTTIAGGLAMNSLGGYGKKKKKY